MTSPATAPRRHEGDGCHCPDYISYCVHVDEGVFWIVSRADGYREFERRTGIKAAPAVTCPQCSARVHNGATGEGEFYVYGPGVPDSPRCVCLVELTMYDRKFMTPVRAPSIEEAFAIIAERRGDA